MSKANRDQINKARQLLTEGKKPVAVVAATGVSLATAYKLYKQLPKPEPPPVTEPAAAPDKATPEEPLIMTRLMNEAEIQKYGPPQAISLADVPKEIHLEIGPVGASAAAASVEAMLEPLKQIGLADIYIKVTAKYYVGKGKTDDQT